MTLDKTFHISSNISILKIVLDDSGRRQGEELSGNFQKSNLFTSFWQVLYFTFLFIYYLKSFHCKRNVFRLFDLDALVLLSIIFTTMSGVVFFWSLDSEKVNRPRNIDTTATCSKYIRNCNFQPTVISKFWSEDQNPRKLELSIEKPKTTGACSCEATRWAKTITPCLASPVQLPRMKWRKLIGKMQWNGILTKTPITKPRLRRSFRSSQKPTKYVFHDIFAYLIASTRWESHRQRDNANPVD